MSGCKDSDLVCQLPGLARSPLRYIQRVVISRGLPSIALRCEPAVKRLPRWRSIRSLYPGCPVPPTGTLVTDRFMRIVFAGASLGCTSSPVPAFLMPVNVLAASARHPACPYADYPSQGKRALRPLVAGSRVPRNRTGCLLVPNEADYHLPRTRQCQGEVVSLPSPALSGQVPSP